MNQNGIWSVLGSRVKRGVKHCGQRDVSYFTQGSPKKASRGATLTDSRGP